MNRQTLPPSQGPEYTRCGCSHIEPEHEPNAGECYSCDCAAYRPAPAAPLPPADPCPTPESHNWGCGCPSDVAAAIASCPGRELSPSPCRCPCYGCKHHCGAHNPETVPPADQTADLVKHVTRSIFALKTPSPDGSKHYQSGWDDGLEAAMDAARDALVAVLPATTEHEALWNELHRRDAETDQPHAADQTALRDRIAATIVDLYNAGAVYALEPGQAELMADALAARLPATTNHDTDTSASHRCADCGGVFVPGSDVELTHNCDDHRTVVEAPAATCSAQYHGPGEDAARLCIRAAQHERTAHTDEHGFHWSDTVAVYPVADATFRTGTDVRAVLRRVADETAATETPCTCFVINDGGVHAVSCAKRADETAATETQAECTASRTGACLREAESETACDTEAGECAHGGQPAAGARQDEAQP